MIRSFCVSPFSMVILVNSLSPNIAAAHKLRHCSCAAHVNTAWSSPITILPKDRRWLVTALPVSLTTAGLLLQHHSFGAATCDLTSEWKNPPASHKIRIILLVEEIMHHLGCIKSKKPVNNGIFYISTGQPDFWTINSPTSMPQPISRWSKAKESCLGDGKLIWYWQGWCSMNYRLCQLLNLWLIWYTGWWFQIFFIFTPIWGRFPIWLIFLGWVETTN